MNRIGALTIGRGSILTLAIFVSTLVGMNDAMAQVGPWTAHASMREALSVDVSDSHVWVGTTGGLFSVDVTSGEVTSYTVVDGLHTVTAAHVAYDDARDVLWVGYEDGVLDRLDPATGTIRSFRDIQRATQFSSRRINRLRMNGDTLYAATDFGLVVFDAARAEVRDAYSRFGSLSSAIPVYDFAFGSLDDGTPGIWVGTAEGVAMADREFINLQDPAVWQSEEFVSLGPVRSIAASSDSVYVGLDDGLRVRVAPGNYEPRGTIDRSVTQLSRLDDRVIGVSQFRLFQITDAGTASVVNIPGVLFPSSVAAGPDGFFWVAGKESGLAKVVAGTPDATFMEASDFFFPDGPRDGTFSSSSIGTDGTLLLGGTAGDGKGFYHLKSDGTWTSYNKTDHPELGERASFSTVNIDGTGALWAGSAGGGLVRVDPDSSIVRFDATNSTLRSVSGLPDFIIIGGVDADRANDAWVTTIGAPSPLHYRMSDGTWTGFPPYVGQGLTSLSSAYGSIYIDSFDQKWIIVKDESSFSNTRGVMVVDTGSDPVDQGDDSFRFFRSVGGGGQGLPSTNVTAVVEDRNGLVWIGTDRGLAYAVNTGFVARDENTVLVWPQQADRTQNPYLLFGLPITSLAVDPANRLWVGTNEGIRIVEATEGGFREVGGGITTANAPLPSNAIVTIAIEPQSGNVYVVTDGGDGEHGGRGDRACS